MRENALHHGADQPEHVTRYVGRDRRVEEDADDDGEGDILPVELTEPINRLDEVPQFRFDLFLLDHTYPEASGVTVCRELRSLHPNTPILFYSARAMPEERRAALDAGANDYLVKPQDLFYLTDRIAELVAGSKP